MPKPITITSRVTRSVTPPRAYFARAIGRAFEIRGADTDVCEIALYDEIGYWGTTARQFRDTLKAVKAGTINLKINSPGGDVFDGIAMYNDLVDHAARGGGGGGGGSKSM